MHLCCIYLDLKKAFDTIDHKILLTELKSMGFPINTYALLQNYLTDRKQIAIVNDTASTSLGITHGIPQGSTLGPLLFILYINDVVRHFQGVSVSLYVDDTMIYNANADPQANISILNHNADLFYPFLGVISTN